MIKSCSSLKSYLLVLWNQLSRPAVTMSDYCTETVDIFKTDEHRLGHGAYGEVFKAKRGMLPCAAKLLHKTLFDSHDSGSRTILERFKLECSFMFSIRHPNVVQFLGMTFDPTSGFPVLLMELLDESLTVYLERSRDHLPFYIQVNFVYDISLAITYLHSKDIVHRDLSSNNVLLLAGYRAKVSDFGLARIIDENPSVSVQNSLSCAPGSLVYMPPEALRDPPDYTNKLDCFSIGPLIIQIATRIFPNPGPRTRRDPDSKEVELLIPDIERRENHICLIPNDHPLLSIAKKCLDSDPDKRLTAVEIVDLLSQMKTSALYLESKECAPCVYCQGKLDSSSEPSRVMVRNQDEQITQQYVNISSPTEQPDTKKASNTSRSDSDSERTVLLGLREEKLSRSPCCMVLGSATSDSDTAYFRPAKSHVIHSFTSGMCKWAELPPCPNGAFALVVINKVLVAVGGFDYKDRDTAMLLSLVTVRGEHVWRELLPRMPSRRSFVATACNQDVLVVAGGSYCISQYLNTVEVLDIANNLWYVASDLPLSLSEASANICGNKLFIVGGCNETKWTNSVIACSLSVLVSSSHSADDLFPPPLPSLWKRHCDIPAVRCASVAVDNQLLAVNGKLKDGKRTNSIYLYKEEADKWEEVGATVLPRTACLVVILSRRRLLVVGGYTESDSNYSTLEMVQLE